ncbi:hypothetical protein EGT07_15410 [Herbaspirillum sp. HC18]|nr:hypothetical protein EGT07_15410 [Herbaspirillum sp. HC18]
MWELLVEPAKIFIKAGIDAFRKSDEIKNLTIAIQDRVRREARFNAAVLDELGKEEGGQPKNPEDVRVALVKSLKTVAFDDIDNGAIPISLFFSTKLDRDKWPNWKNKDQYLKYTASDVTQIDLLERVYHRINLAKTFAECGKLQGNLDYIRFMLAALDVSIKSTQIDL